METSNRTNRVVGKRKKERSQKTMGQQQHYTNNNKIKQQIFNEFSTNSTINRFRLFTTKTICFGGLAL